MIERDAYAASVENDKTKYESIFKSAVCMVRCYPSVMVVDQSQTVRVDPGSKIVQPFEVKPHDDLKLIIGGQYVRMFGPSMAALIATLQVKRPRLLRRIVGKDMEGNPAYSLGLFYEEDFREFFKNRNNPEGWRPKPPPPYKPPLEIIETISDALAKAKKETEFHTALAGKFTDNDWRSGCSTWDKYLSFIWESAVTSSE